MMMIMDYSRELSPAVFFAPAVSHRTPLLLVNKQPTLSREPRVLFNLILML